MSAQSLTLQISLLLDRHANRQSLVATVPIHQRWSMEEIQLDIRLCYLFEEVYRIPHELQVVDPLTPH